MTLRSHLVVKFHKPQKRTEVSTRLLNWPAAEEHMEAMNRVGDGAETKMESYDDRAINK